LRLSALKGWKMENLDAPRWPGGPAICKATNLPAFETVKDAKAFVDMFPGYIVESFLECEACGGIHVHGHDRGPSGGSSGTSTRHITGRLSAQAQANSERLSKEDSIRWAKTH